MITELYGYRVFRPVMDVQMTVESARARRDRLFRSPRLWFGLVVDLMFEWHVEGLVALLAMFGILRLLLATL